MDIDSKTFRKRVVNLIFNNKPGVMIHRILLIGDDIDVYDGHNVIWAFSTRCRLFDDEAFFPAVRAFPLVPYNTHGEYSPVRGGKVVSDALLAMEYKKSRTWESASFKESYPESVQREVFADWHAMRFENC